MGEAHHRARRTKPSLTRIRGGGLCPTPLPRSGIPDQPEARSASGCFCSACFEVLMRRAVVAIGERRALARLALARRRAAACDAAVERARLDLLLDELRRSEEHTSELQSRP